MSLTASELRDRIRDLDIGLESGTTAGFVRSNDDLNLNALAIGLGLENVEYDPGEFPGLVYGVAADGRPVTTVLFGNGVVAVVDAPGKETARRAITTVFEAMRELGLTDEADIGLAEDVNFADDVPVPDDAADP